MTSRVSVPRLPTRAGSRQPPLSKPVAGRPTDPLSPPQGGPAGLDSSSGIRALWHIAERLSRIEPMLLRQKPPEVLSSRLLQIPSTGVATLSVRGNVRTARVQNQTTSAMTVVNGASPSTTAPTQGDGITYILPLGAATFPVRDTTLTVFGRAGGLANVSLYDKTLDPSSNAGLPVVTTLPYATNVVLGTPGCSYQGWVGYETTGTAPIELVIHDGSSGGTVLGVINLAAGASGEVMANPLQTVGGIYVVQRSGSGAFNGSVRYS